MIKSKTFSPHLIYGPVAAAIVIGVIVSVAVFRAINDKPNHMLALPDRSVSHDEVELCSPYANLCFTRPADWTKSKTLHVNGSADTTIEINPPTGTILELAKSSKDTNTKCDKAAYKECLIKISKIDTLQDELSVVTGMLIASPDANCRENCPSPKYTPFVQLMSQRDLQKYGLKSDTASFEEFNPAVRVKSGQSTYLRVTPGKEFDVDSAQQWLGSSEAQTAQQIFSSVKLYQ